MKKSVCIGYLFLFFTIVTVLNLIFIVFNFVNTNKYNYIIENETFSSIDNAATICFIESNDYNEILNINKNKLKYNSKIYEINFNINNIDMPFFNLTYVDFDKGSYKYVDDFDNIIVLTLSNDIEILVQYNDIQYRFNMVN